MIYVVQPEPGRPVKIGFSRVQRSSEVIRRVMALEPGCPWPLRLICAIEGGTYEESMLHARFADLRIHREWFRLEGELLLWLRGLAGEKVGPSWPQRTGAVVDLAARRAAR